MQPATFSFTILTDHDRMATVSAFYQQHFGLEPALTLDWFASLRRPGESWELCVWDAAHDSVPPGLSATPGGGVLAFIVEDVRLVAAKLEEAGIPLMTSVVAEPWGQTHCYVQDPAGTTIDVVEPGAPDPAWLAEQGFA